MVVHREPVQKEPAKKRNSKKDAKLIIFWIVYFAPRYLSVVVGRKSRLRVYKKNDGLIGLDRAVEAYYKMNNT